MCSSDLIFLEFDGHGFVPGMDPEQALEARLRDLVRQNPGKNQGELITLGILWNLPKNQILDYLADAAASGKLQTKRGPNNSIRYWVPE